MRLKMLALAGLVAALLLAPPVTSLRQALAADEPAKAEKETSADAAGSKAASAESGAKAEDHEPGMPKKIAGPDEIHPDLAMYTLAMFVVLMIILGKFAWGPIIAGLQKREKAVADHVASAQRANEDAKTLLAQYEKKLAGAAEEVRVMMEQARREGELTKAEIVAEAKQAASLEADRGKREIALAKDQALKELSERTAELAVNLASKIVRSQLTQQDHARLAQEAMAQFRESAASVN